MTHEEGMEILAAPDDEMLALLDAAYLVRRRFFGNRVYLNFLINAKSGLCGEDCGYCSQSRLSRADIPRYNLVDPQSLLDGARLAAERRARTYCTVLSGVSPSEDDLRVIAQVVPEIKVRWNMKVCLSPGFLSAQQAVRLKQCGVDRINHNLNTSRRFYPSICTTHTYQQRLETLRVVRAAGMEICSGGIVGMGEGTADVVELARTFGELAVEAQPINFLLPIPGTRLEGVRLLSPRYCLKVLALMRLANPPSELRIAAGREEHLGPLQPLGLYAASSIFVGDYLTCKGQPPEDDYRMIEALGFEIAEER